MLAPTRKDKQLKQQKQKARYFQKDTGYQSSSVIRSIILSFLFFFNSDTLLAYLATSSLTLADISLVISLLMILRQQKIPTTMKTMVEIIIAAIIPPLLGCFCVSSSLHAWGWSTKLSHTMLKAFSALSCSTCLIPLTEISGILIIPVLTSNLRHSIKVSNELIDSNWLIPSYVLTWAAHCLLFNHPSAHFLSNRSIYSNHWSVLFCLAKYWNILYCENCSYTIYDPTPDLQLSRSNAQQLLSRIHYVFQHDLHSIV